MKLFVSFGSWGEIAPLLEIALQLQDIGERVSFCTTDDWSARVRAYGMECHEFPCAPKHGDSLNDFIRAHFSGRMKMIYERIESLKPDSLVSPFYCFPAHAYAQKHDVKLTTTTTTPYYFTLEDQFTAFTDCMEEFEELKKSLGISGTAGFELIGLYPWYLHEDIGCIEAGFPVLRPLVKYQSKELQEFTKEPYGVISRGTLIGKGQLDRMVNAIKAHGLRCLYLGKEECDAELCIPFADNHFDAVKKATVAITHAGVGTIVDCMGLPMVVDPVDYDQHYNAQRLIELHCAVPAGDSYIRAISAAMRPHSFLPNHFSLEPFHEYSSRDFGRHAANVGERRQIH